MATALDFDDPFAKAEQPQQKFKTSLDFSDPFAGSGAPKAQAPSDKSDQGLLETGARALGSGLVRVASDVPFLAGGVASTLGATGVGDKLFGLYDKGQSYARDIEGAPQTSTGGKVAQFIGSLPAGLVSLGADSMVSPAADVVRDGGTLGDAYKQLGLNTAANAAGLGVGGIGRTIAQRVVGQGLANVALGEASRQVGNAMRGPDQQQEFDPIEAGLEFGTGAAFGFHGPHAAKPRTIAELPGLAHEPDFTVDASGRTVANKGGYQQRDTNGNVVDVSRTLGQPVGGPAFDAQTPAPPMREPEPASPAPAPLALGHEPDVIVDSRGRAVLNKGDQTLGTPFGGPGFEQQTAAPPVSEAEPAQQPQPLAIGHEPDVIVDSQGRAVVNKGDRTLGQPFGGRGLDEQAPQGMPPQARPAATEMEQGKPPGPIASALAKAAPAPEAASAAESSSTGQPSSSPTVQSADSGQPQQAETANETPPPSRVSSVGKISRARDGSQVVETSVGPRKLNDTSYDVGYGGSSQKDGTIVLQRGFDYTIPDGPLKGLDTRPFLAEHEAVERDLEDRGTDYTDAHHQAQDAEHGMLLEALGLKRDTPEADQAIDAYEAHNRKLLEDSASVKDPKNAPNLVELPYEHPHTAAQRQLLADTEQAGNVPAVKAERNDDAFNFRRPSDDAANSTQATKDGGSLRQADVQRIVNRITSNWKGDAPERVIVHQSHDTAPLAMRRSSGFDRSIEGAYDPQTESVHLFADALKSPQRAEQVLAHEVIGHYGVERVVGKDWGKFVSDVNAMRGNAPKTMRDVMSEVERRYPGADAETFAAETMAVMAEKGVHNALWDRVRASVQRFLRTLGFDRQFNDAELRQILVAARSRVEGSASAATGAQTKSAPSFSAKLENAAREAATHPENPRPEPSDAQKEAGNYAKGHIKLHGLDIAIENPAGTSRRPEWPPLENHYGYIKRTEGADGDHVDVFLGNHAHDADRPVFVVDQVDPKTGKFDEHKVIMGARTADDARKMYQANYAKDWQGLGAMREMSLDQFKDWVREGDLKKPASGRLPAFSKGESDTTAEQTSGIRSHPIPDQAATPIARYRNDAQLKADPDYRAAKNGNVEAAARLVERQAQPMLKEIQGKFGKDAIYVAPHAIEAGGENAIPQTMAAYFAHMTGARDDLAIVQKNRAFHTGANAMERLIARSEFDGDVEKGAKYVLTDDVTTMGGTMADLAHYIQAKGGDVVGSVNLVNASRSGKIGGDKAVSRQIERRYGDEVRKLFGIDPAALTSDEARYLIGFRNADEIRNRAASAAQERDQRIRSKGLLQEGSVKETNAPPSEGRSVSGDSKSDIKFSRAQDRENPDGFSVAHPLDIQLAKERIASQKYEKPYAQLAPEEREDVNAVYNTTSMDRSPMFSRAAQPTAKQDSFIDRATGFFRPGAAERAANAIKKAALDQRELARGVSRAAWAERDRAIGTADAAIDANRTYFDKRSADVRNDPLKSYAGVIAYQQGKEIANPNERRFIGTMANILDQQANQIRSFGEDKLNLLEQYFPQLWKDPERAEKELYTGQQRKPLAGNTGFRKERVFADYEQGIKAGMVPAFENPADAIMARYQAGERYLSALRIRKGIDGLGLLKKIGTDDRVPAGYARVNDNTFAGHVVPELVARDLNNYLAPGLSQFKAWRTFRWLQNTLLSARLGFSAFHAGFTTVDAAITHFDLGMRYALDGDIKSAIHHLVQVPLTPAKALQGIFGKGQGAKLVRQFYGKDAIDDPHTAAVLDALTKGGARAKMDPTDYNNDFGKMIRTWRTDGAAGLARTPLQTLGGVLEGVMHPIASNLVPAQKMVARVEMMKYELDRVASQLGKQRGDYAGIAGAMNEQALRQVAHSVVQRVDDRLGQLAYDNLFWNRTVKDILQASIQSVGWNVGTKNVILGGLGDVRKIFNPETLLSPLDKEGKLTNVQMSRISGRLSYLVALNLGIGALGAATQYMLTGQGPQELRDYFFPKTGNKNPDGTDARMSYPSYVKDEFGFARHPIDTVEHKLHPSFSMVAELLNNKDFYGNQVYNPDDPWTKVAGQVAEHIVGGYVPYAFQNQQNVAAAGGSLAARVAPFVGITPAPGDITHSDAQNYIAQAYYSSHPTGGKTPEKAAQGKAFSAAVAALRSGQQPDLSQFTPRDQNLIQKYAREDPSMLITKHFAALNLQQQLVAYGKASPAEQTQYRMRQAILHGAAKSLAKETDPETRARLSAKVDELRSTSSESQR